jgi:hypothetical protein
MDTTEAGRKGGLSRSAKKSASSRRNIAKARAVTAEALAAWRAACKKTDVAGDAFYNANPADNSDAYSAYAKAGDVEMKSLKKIEKLLPVLFVHRNGSQNNGR